MSSLFTFQLSSVIANCVYYFKPALLSFNVTKYSVKWSSEKGHTMILNS